MNKFVTNKAKFPQDGAQEFFLDGVVGYYVTLSEGVMIANHPIYGVVGYHVTLSEGRMIANHPI